MNYQNQDNQNFRYDTNKVLKNNSRRILYITVIVAALFVAVVSGTFAYFQASVTSPSGAINGGIYDVTAALNSITVTKISRSTAAPNGDNLIPFETDNGTTTKSAMINIALNNGCVDLKGYTSCHVYKIDIKEAANAPRVPISGTISITGTKISNLKFTIINTRSTNDKTVIEPKNGETSLSMTDTYYDGAVTYASSTATLNFTDITGTTNDNFLPANTTDNYYYLIVWLEDTGSDQTSANSGGNYSGTVTVNAVNGSNQHITATFSSGA